MRVIASPDTYTGGSPTYYERDGRRFVEAGIGTIGWGVYTLWHEVDADGNVISQFPLPLVYIFPDPAKVAAQKAREEAERQRLEHAAQFPVEGVSGEWGQGLLHVWPTNHDEDDSAVLSIDSCDFCSTKTKVIAIVAGYDSLDICRDCLGKIFDAFEAINGGDE